MRKDRVTKTHRKNGKGDVQHHNLKREREIERERERSREIERERERSREVEREREREADVGG